MKTDLNKMRFLVLGANGFIGRHLCSRLLDSGAYIRGFDRSIPTHSYALNGRIDEIDWVTGDFGSPELFPDLLDDIDYVFHLISTTIPSTSNQDLSYDLTSNVISTIQLLEAIKNSKVKKLIFVSSGGTIYGIPSVVPIPESHVTSPICGYGIHKLTIEKYLQLFDIQYGVDYSILRLSNPYGIEQVADRPQGVIGNFIHKAINGQSLEIWGDGSIVRDYIYIEDVIDAFLLSLFHRGKHKIFNIGSNHGHSIMQVVETIETVVGQPLRVCYGETREVDVPKNILDIQRAKEVLGWAPNTPFYEGVRQLYQSANARRSKIAEFRR